MVTFRMPLKNESTTTTDVAQANPTRLGTYLRNKPVSGTLLQDDWGELADFVFNLPDESFDHDGLVSLEKILGDIEYCSRSELNEALLKTHKVSNQKSIYARKWYKSRKGQLSARRRKLKTSISAMAADKKRERLKKQKKNLKKKPLKNYNTKNHTNERATFAEMVKTLSKKHSVKDDNHFDKNDYLIADDDFQINEMLIKKNQVFTLIGTKLIFEYQNKKYEIDDATPVLPFLTRI